MRSLGHGTAHFEQFRKVIQGNDQLCPGTPKTILAGTECKFEGLSEKNKIPREETTEAPMKYSVMFGSLLISSI